jgi:AAA+ superfamily predicted ATPase
MEKHATNAFESIPVNAKGHFILNFYVAVYCVINHIRRLGEIGEDDLEKTFEKYPFLAAYLKEMHEYMPEDITWERAFAWWEREIKAWEHGSDEHMPLLSLAEQGNIDFRGRICLIIVGIVEEDSRFGTLFANLQEPLTNRRPSFELVNQIMMDKNLIENSWNVCRPLIEASLINMANKDSPRSEWVLHVPPVLWDVIKGEVGSQPVTWWQHYPYRTFPEMSELICPLDFMKRLRQVPALMKEDKTQAIVLRGQQGSELLQFMGAIACEMNRGIVTVDGSKSVTDQHWELLGPFCSLTHSIPVISFDLGPGETVDVPLLNSYKGPVGIIMGFEGGLRGQIVENAVTLTLPPLDSANRMLYWKKALAGYPVENLTDICEKFHMPGRYINQAASMAVAYATLDRSEKVTNNHVREAFRTLNRQMLDTLATRLEVKGSWNQLAVSETIASKLKELERRCHHRERLLEHLGPGFGSDCNRGVRALFTGPSGTGKTLAAKILAAELGMDLYRVDLAAVVNKYIGETEKNLHHVFSRAEELDVILLLDEGDALLGNRTNVKSANDRYANLETNYLLQKLETYQGIVLITTNAEGNIDMAFKRRMDVVVSFVAPHIRERWHIWQLHLPEDHTIDYPFLEEIALRCTMTGGQIRNAAFHATMLALDEGNVALTCSHLKEAIHSEYRKAGATCPLNDNGQRGDSHGDIEAFLDLLKY